MLLLLLLLLLLRQKICFDCCYQRKVTSLANMTLIYGSGRIRGESQASSQATGMGCPSDLFGVA